MDVMLLPREPGVLVELDSPMSAPWPGEVQRASDAGPLCTRRPEQVTVWAPAGSWPRAVALLAMVKSARPDNCMVLTDVEPPIEAFPHDTWIATISAAHRGPARRGQAAFMCTDLRSDRIFRLLQSGRARRHPELRPLLDLHVLTATTHGARLMERWTQVVQVLFASGLESSMPAGLRSDLDDLADAARDAEHAVTGGFHALDPFVRDAIEWEAGARRYLPLAARRSTGALAVVRQWLAETAGWESATARHQEEHRAATARALHRLADDPWLAALEVAGVLYPSGAR